MDEELFILCNFLCSVRPRSLEGHLPEQPPATITSMPHCCLDISSMPLSRLSKERPLPDLLDLLDLPDLLIGTAFVSNATEFIYFSVRLSIVESRPKAEQMIT